MFENDVRIIEDMSFGTLPGNIQPFFMICFIAGILFCIGGCILVVVTVWYTIHVEMMMRTGLAPIRKILKEGEADDSLEVRVDKMIERVSFLKSWCGNRVVNLGTGSAFVAAASLFIGVMALLYGYQYGWKDPTNTIVHKYVVQIEADEVPVELFTDWEIVSWIDKKNRTCIIREITDKK